MDELKELLRREFEAYEMLICTRVWEAWGYDTMTQDDFALVSEDDEVINELAENLWHAGFRKGE